MELDHVSNVPVVAGGVNDGLDEQLPAGLSEPQIAVLQLLAAGRTLTEAAWNTTVVPEVVPADIERLKLQPGGDLVVGGADLAATFLRHDLIDEYRIYVHPVILGRGRPLFPPPGPKVDLEVVGTRTFGNGVVLLHYNRPATSLAP